MRHVPLQPKTFRGGGVIILLKYHEYSPCRRTLVRFQINSRSNEGNLDNLQSLGSSCSHISCVLWAHYTESLHVWCNVTYFR